MIGSDEEILFSESCRTVQDSKKALALITLELTVESVASRTVRIPR